MLPSTRFRANIFSGPNIAIDRLVQSWKSPIAAVRRPLRWRALWPRKTTNGTLGPSGITTDPFLKCKKFMSVRARTYHLQKWFCRLAIKTYWHSLISYTPPWFSPVQHLLVSRCQGISKFRGKSAIIQPLCFNRIQKVYNNLHDVVPIRNTRDLTTVIYCHSNVMFCICGIRFIMQLVTLLIWRDH